MGPVGVKSVNFLGVTIKFQSATVKDQEKIRGVFEEAGFEEVKQYYYSNPEMMAVFKEQNLEFPEDEGDVDSWFLEMTPEQGRAVCGAFKG